MSHPPSNSTWESIAERKQAEQASRIPKEWRLKTRPPSTQHDVLNVARTCGILSKQELQITDIEDATALLKQIHKGQLTAVDVTRAFCKRAAIAQQLTKCLTEIFFDQALARAAELDKHYTRHGSPVGPLHGLPISLKDTFKLKGLDASIGIAALCYQPATENSVLVDVLLSAGAVLYCKTNIPQTLMSLDSHNNVFGRTLNPANLRLTAGGSSGGEGALVAFRGSLLGVGTDIGGSIRVPAMCNGLVGIKPSAGRVPFAGQQGTGKPGIDALVVRPSAGPIAHSVRDCELFMRVVAQAQSWELDSAVVPLPWMPSSVRSKPLRVGVIRTDGLTTPLPPIAGFLDETVQKLQRSKGAVEVVELDLKDLLARCCSLILKLFSVEGGNFMLDLMEATGEPLSPWLASKLKRKPLADSATVRDWQGQRAALQMEFLKVWKEDGGFWRGAPSRSGSSQPRSLDVIIMPVAPHPTTEIDKWNTAAYTADIVLLDLPAATLPVRKIVEADLKGEMSRKPSSVWEHVNRKLWDGMDRRVYLDSALCLQVVGPKLREEAVLEAMATLKKVLGKAASRSGPGRASL